MKSNRKNKLWMAGGLTAVLAAALILPNGASAQSYSTYTVKNTTTWKTYFNTIPWIEFYKQPSTTPAPAQPANPVQPAQPSKPIEQTPSVKPTEPAQNQTGTAADKSQFATQVITLVNQERAKQGLKPLSGDAALNKMALAKAQDMSQGNYFSHTSPTYGSPFDMMKQFGISYRYAGENIAMGQKTPTEVVKAWMNSEGHRANILSPNFTLIGVGYYNGYWAQEFVGR
ncbi:MULTISPECIES: CAP domain-containing protein [Paenibacillus]|uniref:CAP domain-containing protein n=1 Tax=Paenibacillus TaxID=44249 RepID=UPI002FE1A39B